MCVNSTMIHKSIAQRRPILSSSSPVKTAIYEKGQIWQSDFPSLLCVDGSLVASRIPTFAYLDVAYHLASLAMFLMELVSVI